MSRAGRTVRGALIGGGVAALIAAAGVWGFYVHRNHVFPYRLGRYVIQHLLPVRGRFSPYRIHPSSRAASVREVERLAQPTYLPGYRPAAAAL